MQGSSPIGDTAGGEGAAPQLSEEGAAVLPLLPVSGMTLMRTLRNTLSLYQIVNNRFRTAMCGVTLQVWIMQL